jgi:hypothetical protein
MGSSLAEQLGHAPDARLVIVTCDGLGTTHAATTGVYEAVRDGWATGMTLQVPAPWARAAAAGYRGESLGVELTLNSDWDLLRWGPITSSPSLLDGDGGFPRSVQELWDHADVDEVRRECRTQVERAILWGFDVSHLASHLGALVLRPEFFDVYLELAVEFALPLRLPGPDFERSMGFPARRLAAEEGVISPDNVVHAHGPLEPLLAELPAGVTEISTRPAVDTPELRAVTPHWEARVADHRQLVDRRLVELVRDCGAVPVSYRELRELQRQGVAPAG